MTYRVGPIQHSCYIAQGLPSQAFDVVGLSEGIGDDTREHNSNYLGNPELITGPSRLAGPSSLPLHDMAMHLTNTSQDVRDYEHYGMDNGAGDGGGGEAVRCPMHTPELKVVYKVVVFTCEVCHSIETECIKEGASFH